MGEYFGEILKRAVNRRDVLKGGLFCTATVAAAFYGGSSSAGDTITSAPVLNFQGIQPNSEDRTTIPQGFKHNVVIRWGDALYSGQNLSWRKIREQRVEQSDVERQKQCFGYNCDFVGYMEFKDSAGTNRSVLVVNHEYCNPEIMFKEPFLTSTGTVSPGRPTREESLLMLEAHGVSVVEVKRKPDGSWKYVKGSRYNRRITGSTECEITGPARGHRLMKTYYDSEGTRVFGTLNNCAAGKTPWGTVLTCEENFHLYFGGDVNNVVIPDNNAETGLIRSIHRRYGVPSSRASYYGFMKHDIVDNRRRFLIDSGNIPQGELSGEPNEAFRFGWVVEIDPQNPNSKPKKRTALGRFKHEAATYAIASDKRVVIYMGDDERFEYVYKFITKGRYNPNDRNANMDLLDEGDLYVARFNDDFTGQWIFIARCEKTSAGYNITVNPLLPEPFRSDKELCYINTRGAADLLGATMMDRPEDMEWNPVTKSVWVALTFNERRGNPEVAVNRWRTTPTTDAIPSYITSRAQNTDRSNPRAYNTMGHILEILEDGEDPSALTFRWRIAMLCGDPKATDKNRKLFIYGELAKADAPAISAPDNFVIDRLGNVWIATDGNPSSLRLRKNDGVYVLNPFTKDFKMFLSGVPGCEICGPEFSSDWKTFFCAIQHPGEAGEDGGSNTPSSRWPYDNPDNPNDPNNLPVPRPSVIAVWREDRKDIFA